MQTYYIRQNANSHTVFLSTKLKIKLITVFGNTVLVLRGKKGILLGRDNILLHWSSKIIFPSSNYSSEENILSVRAEQKQVEGKIWLGTLIENFSPRV